MSGATLGFGRFADEPLDAVPLAYLLSIMTRKWFREQYPNQYRAALRSVIGRLIEIEATL